MKAPVAHWQRESDRPCSCDSSTEQTHNSQKSHAMRLDPIRSSQFYAFIRQPLAYACEDHHSWSPEETSLRRCRQECLALEQLFRENTGSQPYNPSPDQIRPSRLMRFEVPASEVDTTDVLPRAPSFRRPPRRDCRGTASAMQPS